MLLMAFTKLKLAARGNPVHIYTREINDDVTCGVKFSLRSYAGDEVSGRK